MNLNTKKVEILMAEQGISQKNLAERCGMPRQNISAIIRKGKAEPKTVGKLASGLGVDVKDIIEQDDVSTLMRDVEMQGSFDAKRFFETMALIMFQKYGANISVAETETGSGGMTGQERLAIEKSGA